MEVDVAIETPLQDDVRRLVAELNDDVVAQSPDTPAEFVFCMTVEEMAGPETTVWVARSEGVAIGCGALLRHEDGFGEIKRVYLQPSARGKGVAAQLLDAIEAGAVVNGLAVVRLETDKSFAGARRLYERAGYAACGPFADYPDNPYSVFYEKTLSRKTAA